MTQTINTSQSGGGSVQDELKDDAKSVAQSAEKRAEQEARKGRDQAVNTAKATSSAIDSAAEELRESQDAPDWLASMLSSASHHIDEIATELDGKEPREMVRSVERFGRQQPSMFLAASAAIGFAAGRYLRAGAEQHDDIDGVHSGSPSEDNHRSDGRSIRGASPSYSTASETARPATTFAANGENDPVTRGGRI